MMPKDAFYFSHDSNAHNDPKILAMMTKYQWHGYGMYWAVVEIMREQENYSLTVDKYTYNALAMHLHMDASATEEFMNDCINEFGLFVLENNKIFSNSLIRRMAIKENIAEKRRVAANKRWNKNSDIDANALQKDNTLHSKSNAIKESKGKEIKESKKKKESFNPLSDKQKFIDNLPDSVYKRGHSKEQVLVVLDSLIDYCKSKGKNYKDYYATLRNFLKNEPINNTSDSTVNGIDYNEEVKRLFKD